jgi:hypothetical protein
MTMVARCDFTNYTGSNVIRTNSISVYSSIFTIIVLHLLLLGQLEQILKDVLLDSSNMFEAIQSNNSNIYCKLYYNRKSWYTRTANSSSYVMYSTI